MNESAFINTQQLAAELLPRKEDRVEIRIKSTMNELIQLLAGYGRYIPGLAYLVRKFLLLHATD